MKKLFIILALTPLMSFANQNVNPSALQIFKSGCKNDKNHEQRQRDCELVKKVEKANTIANSFSKNRK